MSFAEENDIVSEGNDTNEPGDISGGNHGWADAMSKVLKSDKPKKKKSLVLSKAKRICDYVDEPKEELPFEIEQDGEIRKETIIEKKLSDQDKKSRTIHKRKDCKGIKIKPDAYDREKERLLRNIATKGVVKLFNAVRDQQEEIETELEKCGPLERKRSQVLKNVDKNSFLDVLMGGTKSVRVDEELNSLPQKKEKKEEKDNGVWKVLRDDYGMKASIKDWKEDEQIDQNQEESDDMEDVNSDSS